ncbi:hypothetical protein R5R35_009851 [Gryllus longicercus]|uniref:PID domain-containing protein n=1 Tax=Gryllus longicercus TaxID=2509291 RepID=A0AAN9VXR2_9ORTH
MVKCTEDRAASATRRLADPAALDDDLIVPNGHRPLHSTDHPPAGGGAGGGAGGSVYGFRLCPGGGGGGDAASVGERESATSASVYSFYKQRIDAMFDETRSQLSGAGGGGGGGGGGRGMSDHAIYHRLESEEEQRQRRINNSVQARIERMFSEMATSGDLNIMRNLSQAKAIACNRFGVDYLGSVALHDKVTSLQGLQRPLSDLYFAYCRLREGAGGGEEEPSSGTLEISGCGLKVHHGGGPDQTELEQLNPFPTIAVWAAVKFVSRRRSEDGALEYAFLPLIADPDAIDKGALFRPLNPADQRAVEAAAGASAADIDPSYNHHSPLFAVVMRKLGVSRQLECHGFVCACSEDAIVIAANLYQALMAFMQTRNHGKQGKQGGHASKGPRNKNGVSYVSLASSSVAGDPPDVRSILSGRDDRALPVRKHLKEALSNGNGAPPKLPPKTNSPEPKDTIPLPKRSPSIKIPPPVPVRPPRRKTKSTTSSASEDSEEPIVIQKGLPPKQSKSPQPMDNGGRSKDPSGDAPSRIRHNRSESEPCTGTVGVAMQQGPLGVRRTASDLHGYNASAVLPPFGVDSYEGGDILTKVAIPRSRSFLNAGGPHTRYGRRQSMGPGFGPGGFEGGGGGGGNGSPLGFKELFAEFRIQEGLNSMDDILNAIIDAEGMSFNDLKPIYKEFLLKLAVTLTKDELYQRSKSIMRRQRKKMNRRKGGGCVNRKKSFSSGGGGIKRVFRRSVNKLKQSKSRPQSFEFTSVLFPSSVPLRASKKIRNGGFSVESTTTSTSSYSARNFHLQRQPGGGGGAGTQGVRVGISRALRLPRRLSSASSAKRRQRDAPARKRSQVHSASEDSDFFSLARASAGGAGGGGGGGGGGGHHSREHSGAAASSSTALANQNRSSSGYFSCSECSYDSESCTCTSADKCYCSLGEGKSKAKSQGKRSARGKATPTPSPPAPAPPPPGPGPRDRTLSSCGCDTDSCLESDKCYCSLQDPAHHHHRHGSKRSPGHVKAPAPAAASVFDQLKQRGFAVSESSMSRAPSPSWQHQPQQRRHSHAHSGAGSVRAVKSLEALEATAAAAAVAAAAAARAKHPLLHTRRTRSDESAASGGCGFNRNRMDVYAPPSSAGTPSAYASFRGAAPAAPSAPSRRSYSSDNLVVDYDLFTTSSRSEAEEEDAAAAARAQAQASRLAAEDRVLVVSARDPRGRIIYMGASCRSDAGSRRGGGPLAAGGSVRVPSVAAAAPELHAGARRRRRASAAAAAAAAAASANEALSVKKSAEIAAVFSDMKAAAAAGAMAPGDDCRLAAVPDAAAHGKDMFYSGVHHSDYYFASRTSTKSYLGSSLENSLGYLP